MTQFSAQVNPINSMQMQQVTELTRHYIDQAQTLFHKPIQQIPVQYDLKGRSAGMFRIRNGESEIRYNPWIFALHFEKNLHDTVPHEVAHYAVNTLFGHRGIKPHGREWQNVMIAFGREPKTTCDFSIEGVPTRKLKHFAYHCACRPHKISSIRHNRVLRGQVYFCRHCHSRLEPVTLSGL